MAKIHFVIPTTTKFDMLPYAKPFEKFGLSFTQSHIDWGPASVESEFDELFSGPDTVIKAIEAEKAGAEAIIIVCMGDPALHQTREAVSIPVIGPGETAMHYAAMLGHKFSIIPTLERRISTYEYHARKYGLESRLASVRPACVSVLEIEKDPKIFEILLAQAEAAVVEDHADVIILGCLGFQNLDRKIQAALADKGLHVTVIDALPISIMTAATLVRANLSHSPKAFPLPPAKAFGGYRIPPFNKKF